MCGFSSAILPRSVEYALFFYETGSAFSLRLVSTPYVAKEDPGLSIFLPLLPSAEIAV